MARQSTQAAELDQRCRQWEAFHRWEEEQSPVERDPAHIMADFGAVLSWLPEEERLRDPDPQKVGVKKLREACAILNRRL